MTFQIDAIDKTLLAAIKQKIDSKTKPIGALGQIEEIAQQICLIQQSLNPQIKKAQFLVFAGDHGIATKGEVNPYPQAVTQQMVLNFLHGGAAINVFCRQMNLPLQVINAGVNANFSVHPKLKDWSLGMGTDDYTNRPAMSRIQCQRGLERGAQIIEQLSTDGCNCIGLGEMGIGNTSSAALLMHWATRIPMSDCVGSGTGLDEKGVERKRKILEAIFERHQLGRNPLAALQTFGGFEIVMLVGAILKAAELKMSILVDGFIVTSAALMAVQMHPNVRDYLLFAHSSAEKGHRLLLEFLHAKPILQLGLRLGEGTGAALAMPILEAAVAFVNEMASFESAGVSQKDE